MQDQVKKCLLLPADDLDDDDENDVDNDDDDITCDADQGSSSMLDQLQASVFGGFTSCVMETTRDGRNDGGIQHYNVR